MRDTLGFVRASAGLSLVLMYSTLMVPLDTSSLTNRSRRLMCCFCRNTWGLSQRRLRLCCR